MISSTIQFCYVPLWHWESYFVAQMKFSCNNKLFVYFLFVFLILCFFPSLSFFSGFFCGPHMNFSCGGEQLYDVTLASITFLLEPRPDEEEKIPILQRQKPPNILNPI